MLHDKKKNTKKGDAFKVIIAGGSIAGLTLALMLERLGIDFVLLEGYEAIAPQVGASIALLPNGLRVLDQLGCYEDIAEAAEKGVDKFSARHADMTPIMSVDGFAERLTQRYGYPMMFLDRRMVIEALYKNVGDKSKILTGQRVTSITATPNGVTVLTKCGDKFTGDIAVGCDGVHSTVRKEIARLEGSSQEDQLVASYSCVWGIATDVPHVPKGLLTNTYGDKYSYLFADGPGNRCYFALLVRMEKEYVGDEIPKFDRAHEAEMAKQHENDYVAPGIKFGDIYRRQVATICTPLAEAVFKTWHSGRLMLVGDSAHKFEPLSGQGGNNAIETAAAFVNSLHQALKSSPAEKLTSQQLSAVFESTQKTRSPRASRLVKDSHEQQDLEANHNPIITSVTSQILKFLSTDTILEQIDKVTLDAVSLDMLALPNRPRQVPWDDERHRRPSSRGWLTLALIPVYLALAYYGASLCWGASFANGSFDLLDKVFIAGQYPNGDPIAQHFTGFAALDEFLSTAGAFFFPATLQGWRQPDSLVIYYLFMTVFALDPILIVEGNRKRSRWTLLACAGIWLVAGTLVAVAVIFPLFFLVHALYNHSSSSFVPTTRAIPKYIADNLFLGVIFGFALPSLAMFTINDPMLKQKIICVWQFTGLMIVGFTKLFARVRISQDAPVKGDEKIPTAIAKDSEDLPGLLALYKRMFTITAVCHVALLGAMLTTSVPLYNTFVPENSYAPVDYITKGPLLFMQADVVIVVAAMFVWGAVNIFDLYRTGLSNVAPVNAVGLLFAGFIVVGPGAAMNALWAWRENLMAKTSFGRVAEA